MEAEYNFCQVICWFSAFFFLTSVVTRKQVFLCKKYLWQKRTFSLKSMAIGKRDILKVKFSEKGLSHTRSIDTRKVHKYSSNFIKIFEVSLMLNAGWYKMSSASIMTLMTFLDRLENAWRSFPWKLDFKALWKIPPLWLNIS